VTTRTLGAMALSAALLVFGGAARAGTEYDYNDYTLDAPPAKHGKFTVRQAASLTENWDKRGVLRIAVVSDHNQDYELWSGLELIDLATKQLYNVNAVRCFVSFCLYVGKVPPGKYFINRLYADSFVPTSVAAPIRKMSAPIRNALGSFDVRVHSLTDLGMIGIFRGVAASRDQSFETAFLGYFADLALLYDETYRGYPRQYFGLAGPELHWDAGEWEKAAIEHSLPQRRFYADFSRPQAGEHGFFFPTVMGAIYSLDWERKITRGDVGAMFMLTALSMAGDRWMAGSEAGRVYVSTDHGASWTATDPFPRDEVVAHLFERNGVLHALTVSQQQAAAKLYRASGGTSFTEISRTRLALESKVKMPRLLMDFAGGRPSLTQTYLNREDLKKVRVLESGDFLTVQLNSRHFASFDFAANSWRTYGSEQRVPWVAANRHGICLMSQSGDSTVIRELGAGLSGQRSYQELPAVPRGGIAVRDDGSKLAVLSLDVTVPARGTQAQAQIYALVGDAKPSLLRPLDDVAVFFDSELHAIDDALVLIDRVAPRVHRFVGSSATTYTLYDP
jgi:hypothetical protein